jgi:hypothetical protein
MTPRNLQQPLTVMMQIGWQRVTRLFASIKTSLVLDRYAHQFDGIQKDALSSDRRLVQ